MFVECFRSNIDAGGTKYPEETLLVFCVYVKVFLDHSVDLNGLT